MSTTTNKSLETTIDRLGGEAVIIKTTWLTTEQESESYFKPTDSFKMVVRKEVVATPGTYVDIGKGGVPLYCYSGTAGQGAILYHYDPALSRVLAYTSVVSSARHINAPNFQFVKGYTPKLAAGIYHIQLQRLVTGSYTDFGDPVTMQCQEPSRFDAIYSLKQNFDEEPYMTGFQYIEQGGV